MSCIEKSGYRLQVCQTVLDRVSVEVVLRQKTVITRFRCCQYAVLTYDEHECLGGVVVTMHISDHAKFRGQTNGNS